MGQIRALTRRITTQQTRKWRVNVCCLFACPAITVVIAGLIGITVRNVLGNFQNSSTNGSSLISQNLLSCANINSFTNPSLFPNQSLIPVNTEVAGVQLQAVNFHIEPFQIGNLFSAVLGFGTSASRKLISSAGFTALLPCVYTFGTYSPDESGIYFPAFNNNVLESTTFIPDPKNGWFGLAGINLNNSLATFPSGFQPPFLALDYFQTSPWAYTSGDSVGSRPEAAPLELPLNSFASPRRGPRPGPDPTLITEGIVAEILRSVTQTTTGLSNATGLLSELTPKFYANVTVKPGSINSLLDLAPNATTVSLLQLLQAGIGIPNLQAYPYFDPHDKSPEDTDDFWTDEINRIVHILGKVPGVNTFNKVSFSSPNAIQSLSVASRTLTTLGWGDIRFTNFDANSIDYVLNVGSDSRLDNVPAWPVTGLRMMALSNMISNAFSRERGVQIGGSWKVMPKVVSTKFDLPISLLSVRILFPFAISFLIPVFVFWLVEEKERKILMAQKMAGLSLRTYFFTRYFEFLLLELISMVVFLLVALAFRLEIISIHAGPIILVIFVWINTAVVFAFFLAAFFSRSRNALVSIFTMLLLSIVIFIAATAIWDDDPSPAFFIFPPFAAYSALGAINDAAIRQGAPAMTASTMTNVVRVAIYFMLGEWAVFGIFSGYFHVVVQSEYGLSQKWYMPIIAPVRVFKRHKERGKLTAADRDKTAETSSSDSAETYALHVQNAEKFFGKHHVVRDVTLSAGRGELISLLGPNGAGKTTLISILTGLYPMSGGKASISGYNVSTHIKEVYRNLGVCFQHDDSLWPELTCIEHLLFYARLRGIPIKKEKEAVDTALEAVELMPYAKHQSRQLSGGQRRRLSIAIAVVGFPAVIILDEPTTGLSPEIRRQIWRVIKRVNESCCILLTTHSMLEADVLSTRVAIMVRGRIKAMDTPSALKREFGGRYRLNITARNEVVSRSVTKG